jgi:hypothetical protein
MPPTDAGREAPLPPRDAAPDALPTGAGESVCSSTCAGSGLACTQGTLGATGLCTYSCARNTDCALDHECVVVGDGTSFPSSCFKMCTNRVCPSGMFCWVESGDGVCTPTDWQVRGVGDDCTEDAQCITGLCMNGPNGWCTRPCSANDLCEHYAGINPPDYRTNHDENNWCMQVSAGTDVCVPSCDFSPLDCNFYPGTTCRQLTDIDGFAVGVCLP